MYVINNDGKKINHIITEIKYIIDSNIYIFSFYAQLLNRRQQKLQLVLIQLLYMTPISTELLISDYMPHRTVPVEPVQVLLEETTNMWINVRD